MEIAKFVLTAVGTFISVLALSFTVFSYWKKEQEKKNESFKKELKDSVEVERQERVRDIETEADARVKELEKLEKRVSYLETNLIAEIQKRMSTIEGELKAMRPILQSIQDWFIKNTPKG